VCSTCPRARLLCELPRSRPRSLLRGLHGSRVRATETLGVEARKEAPVLMAHAPVARSRAIARLQLGLQQIGEQPCVPCRVVALLGELLLVEPIRRVRPRGLRASSRR